MQTLPPRFPLFPVVHAVAEADGILYRYSQIAADLLYARSLAECPVDNR